MGNSLLNISKPTNNLKFKDENISNNDKNDNKVRKEKNLKNPGTVEDIHKDCRSILPHTYNGARIIFNNCLSNNFMASHIINILPIINSGRYKFGISYVGNTRTTNEGNFPLIFGEIQSDGTMDSNIIHYFNNRIRFKFGAEYVGKKLDCYQMSIDYFGNTYSSSFGLANINLYNNSGVIVLQYLQSITENLSIGNEIGIHMKYNGFDNRNIINIITKYKKNDFTLSTSIGNNNMCLTFVKTISKKLKLAIDISTDYQIRNSNQLLTLGYEYFIMNNNFLFRGSIDTKYNICSVIQKKLKDLPYAIFSISGKLNQKSGKFSLGCGIVIS